MNFDFCLVLRVSIVDFRSNPDPEVTRYLKPEVGKFWTIS